MLTLDQGLLQTSLNSQSSLWGSKSHQVDSVFNPLASTILADSIHKLWLNVTQSATISFCWATAIILSRVGFIQLSSLTLKLVNTLVHSNMWYWRVAIYWSIPFNHSDLVMGLLVFLDFFAACESLSATNPDNSFVRILIDSKITFERACHARNMYQLIVIFSSVITSLLSSNVQ